MSKILFIANPLSGLIDKKALLARIEKRVRHPFEAAFTQRPGHATELAREADADIVAAVGGDGTVNEVATGLMGSKKVLAIIPCGSGDGLALHLGISRNPWKAVKTLNGGVVREMDYGLLDGKPFFSVAGVGLDADVAWGFASSARRGLWSYVSVAWKLWQDYRPQTYTITVDGKTMEMPAVLVTVGNSNQWGNQARIASLASVQDGLLNLVAVKPFKKWEIPHMTAKLMLGRIHTCNNVFTVTGKHITIDRPSPGPVHLDGDPVSKGTHIEIEVVPKALRVLVPPDRNI